MDARADAAWTAIELLAVLASLLILLVLAVPVLAGGKGRTQQAICQNNLGIIGRAYAAWATDHGERIPYTTPWWEGGLTARTSTRMPPNPGAPPSWFTSGLSQNAWFHYSWLSNELGSPRVLACPASNKKTATTFSSAEHGGFLNPLYQNKAVSYALTHPLLQEGRSVLNLEGSAPFNAFGAGGTCWYGIQPNADISLPTSQGWRAGVHLRSGGILFTDGSVEQADSQGLIDALNGSTSSPDAGSLHFLQTY